MFRGEPPSINHFSIKNVEYHRFYCKYGNFNLTQILMKPLNNSQDSKYKLIVKRANETIYEESITPNVPIYPSGQFKYHQKEPTSLDIKLDVCFRENIGSKIKNVFKIGHTHNSSSDIHLSPILIPKNGTHSQEFNIPVSDPKDNQFNILMKWNITGESDELMILNLRMADFLNIDMNVISNEYEMFDLKNRDFSERRGEGIRAHHLILGNIDGQLVHLSTAEILHIVSLQWSSIKIKLGEKLMATSHLIGLIHLPYFQHIKGHVNFLTLDPKYEKAMLVRNGSHGDYAIIKGRWLGLKRGIPPRRDKNGRMIRGVKGSPGHLKIEIYSILKRSVQIIDISESFIFEIGNEFLNTKTDLKSGRIEFRFLNKTGTPNLEVESMLAIVFSVSAIHVLLQPKEKPDQIMKLQQQGKPGPVPIISNTRGSRPVRSIHSHVTDYTMFCMFGYYPLISSDCFIHHYHHCHDHEHHGHHDHHGDNCHHDGNNDQHDDNNFDNTIDTNVDGWLSGDIEGVDTNNGNYDGGVDGTNVGGCGGCGSGGGGTKIKLKYEILCAFFELIFKCSNNAFKVLE